MKAACQATKSAASTQKATPRTARSEPTQPGLAPPTYGIPFVDRHSADAPVGSREARHDQAPVVQLRALSGNRSSGRGGASRESGLPLQLKSSMESLSGRSLKDVRVVFDSPAPARIGALATARGSEIHLGPGQERHLPHEAWHVVQQRQGRVNPTANVGGIAVNDDGGLEREADRKAEQAMQVQSARPVFAGAEQPPSSHDRGQSTMPVSAATSGSSPGVLQGVFTEREKQRIAGLSMRKRIRLLARASEEDYLDYLDSSYHGNNYLGAEENDEIRDLRKRKATRAAKLHPPDVSIDDLIESMAALSLEDKPDVDDETGVTPMDLDEPQVSISRTDFHASGDVKMEDVNGIVDVEMTDVSGAIDLDMEDVDGFVAMDIDHVDGDVDINAFGIDGAVRLDLTDVDLAHQEEDRLRYDAMEIDIQGIEGKLIAEIYPGSEPMDLEFGPVAAGETQIKRIDKRRRPEDWEEERPTKPAKRHKARGGPVEEEESESEFQGSMEQSSDFDIDSLIEQFAELTVSFRSDIDHQQHQIYPAPQLDEVIVESNPTPLKTIISTKKWQGVAIAGGIIAALKNLQQDATDALKAFATARSKAAGNTLRKALKAIAKQLKALGAGMDLPPTNLSKSTNHQNNSKPTEGTKVVADPLSLNSKSVGHKPNDGRLMAAIRNLAAADSKSYKQMHLLNDNVFGPGELWNLTPGPAKSNSDMEHGVETNLKRAIIDKGLVIEFIAQVNYKNDPIAATQTQINQNPDKYRFTDISFKANEYEFDSVTKTWKKGAPKDPAVQAIDGAKVYWKYGNLTPLRPKPKILDTATTAQELNDADIPLGVANRIVAFVAANDPVVLAGKNKKDALAQQIKDYEIGLGKAKAKKINTDWNANAVLWT